MPLPSLRVVTNGRPLGSGPPRESSRRYSGGSGRRSRDLRRDSSQRPISLASDGSGPKSPARTDVREVGRIEGIFAASPEASARTNSRIIRSNTLTVPPIAATAQSRAGATALHGGDYPPQIQRSDSSLTVRTQDIMMDGRGSSDGILRTTTNGTILMGDEESQYGRDQRRERNFLGRPRWKGLRSRLWTLFVCGVITLLILAIYLGLAFNKQAPLRQEFHVLLILMVLFAATLFCHSLIRLVLDYTNSRFRSDSQTNLARIPSVAGPLGYANPEHPIRINLPSPTGVKDPPPVYGLWRCSVRVNPQQFYWQKTMESGNANGQIMEEPLSPGGTQLPRPPSYMSDDGVSYVVEMVPQRAESPLPPHPSEVRRLV